MKKLGAILIMAIIIGILFPNFIYAQKKLGLIIVAHGSPMPQWNTPVLKLEEEVKKIFSERKNNPFSEIRFAFMEFSLWNGWKA